MPDLATTFFYSILFYFSRILVHSNSKYLQINYSHFHSFYSFLNIGTNCTLLWSFLIFVHVYIIGSFQLLIHPSSIHVTYIASFSFLDFFLTHGTPEQYKVTTCLLFYFFNVYYMIHQLYTKVQYQQHFLYFFILFYKCLQLRRYILFIQYCSPILNIGDLCRMTLIDHF